MITTKKKETNPHEITADEALANAGKTLDDCLDSIVPACCDEGCEVEPDGTCSHGCPSVLLSLGVI